MKRWISFLLLLSIAFGAMGLTACTQTDDTPSDTTACNCCKCNGCNEDSTPDQNGGGSTDNTPTTQNPGKYDDFYLSEHAEIFSAMRDLFSENREIDLVTLIDMLVKRGVYNEEESKKYIKVIAETVPSAANVLDYAKIVREKAFSAR